MTICRTFSNTIAVLIVTGLTVPASSGLITWDAGGDGVSTYQEANWTAVDGAAGTDPAAGTVDGNAESSGGLIHDFLVGGSGTAGGGGGAGPNFDLTDTTTLTVQDNATFRMNNSSGVRGGTPFDSLTRANIVGEDSGTVITQFLVEIDVSLSDNADLELKGGGNPLNASTVDLASDWTGEIRFNNETVAAATTEHLSKITVSGSAAVIGANVNLVSDGGSGSVLTVIPEPGSLALLALGGLAIGARRRR